MARMQKFENRQQAGKLLADELKAYADRADVIVLALPRGGVPVAFEIAGALHLPLDVFVVRKLGVPGQQELAMGAIATGDVQVLNESVVDALNISVATIETVTRAEQQELIRREKTYRGNRSPLDVANKVVILVDDGIATGATMRAALKALCKLGPSFIVVAVPVAEEVVCSRLVLMADKVVCLLKPANFYGVGAHYDEFDQTSDAEVHELLAENSRQRN
jgi:putative phosphoribosyl transferase